MKFELNKNLDINELKNKFNIDQKVEVRNLLTDECANFLYENLIEVTDDNWMFEYNRFGTNNSRFYLSEENKQRVVQITKDVYESYSKGRYVYMFDRYEPWYKKNISKHEHLFCEFNEFMTSDSVLDLIAKITNINKEDKYAGHSGFTRYPKNSFLGIHGDGTCGEVVALYQLTKDWNVENGGLLHFVSDDKTQITHVYQNDFNKLILFKYNNHQSALHFVSHVKKDTKSKRLAYGCCYGKAK